MMIYLGLLTSFTYVLVLLISPVWDGRHLLLLMAGVTMLLVGYKQQEARRAAR